MAINPEVITHQTEPHPGPAAVRGFGQVFGLHPLPAATTLTANAMLFGGTIVTAGGIWPLALIVALVLSFITYRSQIHFYGDTKEAAMIKAVCVGLVSAIPVGLPSMLTIPSTVVGIAHTLRRKA